MDKIHQSDGLSNSPSKQSKLPAQNMSFADDNKRVFSDDYPLHIHENEYDAELDDSDYQESSVQEFGESHQGRATNLSKRSNGSVN